MNGYTQINVKKADLLYHRPANQNASGVSLFKEIGDLSLIKFCQMKGLTPYLKTNILNALH